MLEQLAGPFAIVDGFGNPITISAGEATQWDDDVGLVSYATIGGLDGYCVSQLDGVTWLRSVYAHESALSLDVPSGNLLQKEPIFANTLFSFDKFSGTRTGQVATGPTDYVYYIRARLSDRFLKTFGGILYSMPLTDASTETVEYTFNNTWTSMKASISLTANPHIICIIWNNGVVGYYDLISKSEVLPRGRLPENIAAWFSVRLGVFVLLDADLKINIFAVTPKPFALTNPIALTPLIRGHKNRLRVTLTGEHGEVCARETVEWSINGVGELSALQSLTGIDGVAEIDYFGTLDPDTSTQIQAVVRY